MYPYKNLRMPLPYLAPPRHRAPARDRADNGEFDREDMMGNKMDSTQHIEGYIDSDETEYPANVYAAHMPPAVPSPAPALSALMLHQLATRLSLTTPRPGPSSATRGTTPCSTLRMLWSLSPRLPTTEPGAGPHQRPAAGGRDGGRGRGQERVGGGLPLPLQHHLPHRQQGDPALQRGPAHPGPQPCPHTRHGGVR